MRIVPASLFLMLSLFTAAVAQDAKPTPTPTPVDDPGVVKISTNLIQIDVTVTDSKGKTITDLKPEEIEIYENGEKQKITGLSFIAGAKPTVEKVATAAKDAVPVPIANLRPEQVRRTIALVVDDLSLSFESAHSTRVALKRFVDDQMQPGDLVAIVRTGAGMGALQQFTADKRILYSAIEKVKWNPSGTGGTGAFAAIESALPPPTNLPPEELPNAAVLKGSGESLEDFRGQYFATGTIGALRYVVSGMSELPGRKSVILFSDGFKLFMARGGPTMDFLRSLVDTANRSSVVFYTVDARGLQYGGLTAADAVSEPSQPITGEDDVGTDAMTSLATGRRNEIRDSQEGLNFIAYGTGGFAIKNANDLAGGVRKILTDQSYYLVAYQPDTDSFDPATRKFNQLEVKVLRPSAKVRYRAGFFNVASAKSAKPTTQTSGYGQLEAALVSPFGVTGINLRLNALFGNDAKIGSFVRSLLQVDAADLTFTDEKDGTKKAVFDVLAISFGDNGQVVDQLAKGYTMTMSAEAYKRLLVDGFVYNFAFPVKKPGAYQYRVALRDFQSGKVGSASQFIEIPDVKNDRLILSSIILENPSLEEWKKMENSIVGGRPDRLMSDTALRRIKVGSILKYGFEIYNSKAGVQSGLRSKIRIFRDGELVLDGGQIPVDTVRQLDSQRLKAAGAIAMGNEMLPGDYILQVIVTDEAAKKKPQVVTQVIQFEVIR